MKKLLVCMICILFVTNVSAVVPTVDVNQAAQDVDAISRSVGEIAQKLSKIGEIVDIGVQISELKSLQDVEKVGGAICKLCSNSAQQELEQYINQVNDDLCSQFSFAMKSIVGVQNTVNTLQGIIDSFNTNPKAAALALQGASFRTQAAIQGSLAQIQVLLAQMAQKQLAQEKLSKQNNQALYTGIGQSGL